MLLRGDKLLLGVDFTARFIYHMRLVKQVCGEVVGPASSTMLIRGMEVINEFEVESYAGGCAWVFVHDIEPAGWRKCTGMIGYMRHK